MVSVRFGNRKHVLMAFDACFSGAMFQPTKAKPSSYIDEKDCYPVRQFITAGTEDEHVPYRSVFKEVFTQGIKDRFADSNRDGYVTGEEMGTCLARIYEKQEEEKKALLQYQKALNQKNSQTAYDWQIVGFKGITPSEFALKGIQRIEETANPSIQSMQIFENSYHLIENQKYGEAEKFYIKAIEMDPNNGWAYICLGIIYELKGENQRAKLNYQTALARDAKKSTYKGHITAFYGKTPSEIAIQKLLNPSTPEN